MHLSLILLFQKVFLRGHTVQIYVVKISKWQLQHNPLYFCFRGKEKTIAVPSSIYHRIKPYVYVGVCMYDYNCDHIMPIWTQIYSKREVKLRPLPPFNHWKLTVNLTRKDSNLYENNFNWARQCILKIQQNIKITSEKLAKECTSAAGHNNSTKSSLDEGWRIKDLKLHDVFAEQE